MPYLWSIDQKKYFSNLLLSRLLDEHPAISFDNFGALSHFFNYCELQIPSLVNAKERMHMKWVFRSPNMLQAEYISIILREDKQILDKQRHEPKNLGRFAKLLFWLGYLWGILRSIFCCREPLAVEQLKKPFSWFQVLWVGFPPMRIIDFRNKLSSFIKAYGYEVYSYFNPKQVDYWMGIVANPVTGRKEITSPIYFIFTFLGVVYLSCLLFILLYILLSVLSFHIFTPMEIIKRSKYIIIFAAFFLVIFWAYGYIIWSYFLYKDIKNKTLRIFSIVWIPLLLLIAMASTEWQRYASPNPEYFMTAPEIFVLFYIALATAFVRFMKTSHLLSIDKKMMFIICGVFLMLKGGTLAKMIFPATDWVPVFSKTLLIWGLTLIVQYWQPHHFRAHETNDTN